MQHAGWPSGIAVVYGAVAAPELIKQGFFLNRKAVFFGCGKEEHHALGALIGVLILGNGRRDDQHAFGFQSIGQQVYEFA